MPTRYFKNDEHTILHQWIGLFDPNSSDSDEMKGLVKVSVAIQGPSDSSVRLVDQSPSSLEQATES